VKTIQIKLGGIKAAKLQENFVEMDAAISRAEAYHHLKTLAETYIYFHWVGITNRRLVRIYALG
jgi:hypothetical protein